MRLSIFAPAKVNLSLHVGRAGPDGRHPLESVVAFADVGDSLTMEQGPTTLRVDGPFAAALDGENLISRALALAGVSASVRLEKNLPVASGIGGGSSDAAAALRGAARLYHLAADDLSRWAAQLGADVPVCLACAPAFMTGTGEAVTPIAFAELPAVLVNPGVAAPTGPVYRQFDAMNLGTDLQRAPLPAWSSVENAIAALQAMRNDLETPACVLVPAIRAALERLTHASGVLLARMSGSGATCFALMENEESAQRMARTLARERPEWWVKAAMLGAVDASPRQV